MDPAILKIVGAVAGIGGLALGVLLLLYREVIRKNIFPQLSKLQAYLIIRLIIILVFSIAVIGIVAWVWVQAHSSPSSVSKPVTFKTCRHPDFGQSGWGKEETLQGTSGWRGGGYNQDAYCADYINSIVSSRKLTATVYKIDKVRSSEEGRWTGTFGRDRQYNYHCTVKLFWEPIYNERRDERCGVLD